MSQTALITGANSGLGYALAQALAQAGWRLGLVARDPKRGQAALEQIRAATGNDALELFIADLVSQQQVHSLAEAVLGRFDELHLLINNAGTAFRKRHLSPERIECALTVNHLAPFLLILLVLDRLKASAPAQVIQVGTRIDTALDLEDWNWERRPYRMLAAYGQSKLGMLHCTFELARRLEGTGVRVNCVFPGVFRSNLGKTDGGQGFFWQAVDRLIGWALPRPEQAARGVLRLVFDPSLQGLNGAYLWNGRPIPAPLQARDPEMNRRVWELSLALAGLSEISYLQVASVAT
ncbi:SDR family NAD(P)-dependent oxidoreductase [Caldichromatium japonicum]|uniref:SDR family NAD(P)-dependent oxidoreductase n=1 Tax=Caldichromatium japonicum TaxID=2699430 RepID=A0A6G7VG22_9GAMM|nr:SDR family NAD(P)-dependent oxidoreductase [Caldichromatium japonicum]QIK38815.1 SDR family NAD(P)-dependent oxidoreductase [Caldichromatium japonicum]